MLEVGYGLGLGLGFRVNLIPILCLGCGTAQGVKREGDKRRQQDQQHRTRGGEGPRLTQPVLRYAQGRHGDEEYQQQHIRHQHAQLQHLVETPGRRRGERGQREARDSVDDHAHKGEVEDEVEAAADRGCGGDG